MPTVEFANGEFHIKYGQRITDVESQYKLRESFHEE